MKDTVLFRHGLGLVEVAGVLHAVTGCEICLRPSGLITQRYRVYDQTDSKFQSKWTPVQSTSVKKTRIAYWRRHFERQGFEKVEEKA